MMKKSASDLIFIKWVTGVIFFLIFIFILQYFGFMNSLINNDASYITSLIFIIFIYLGHISLYNSLISCLVLLPPTAHVSGITAPCCGSIDKNSGM